MNVNQPNLMTAQMTGPFDDKSHVVMRVCGCEHVLHVEECWQPHNMMACYVKNAIKAL